MLASHHSISPLSLQSQQITYFFSQLNNRKPKTVVGAIEIHRNTVREQARDFQVPDFCWHQ
jgi:hypothetical protein